MQIECNTKRKYSFLLPRCSLSYSKMLFFVLMAKDFVLFKQLIEFCLNIIHSTKTFDG